MITINLNVNLEIIKFLFENYKTDFGNENCERNSILLLAAFNKNFNIFKFILEKMIFFDGNFGKQKKR